jgi:hypothetical protein
LLARSRAVASSGLPLRLEFAAHAAHAEFSPPRNDVSDDARPHPADSRDRRPPHPTMPTPYDLTTTDYHCALASSLPAHDTTLGCPSGAPLLTPEIDALPILRCRRRTISPPPTTIVHWLQPARTRYDLGLPFWRPPADSEIDALPILRCRRRTISPPPTTIVHWLPACPHTIRPWSALLAPPAASGAFQHHPRHSTHLGAC